MEKILLILFIILGVKGTIYSQVSVYDSLIHQLRWRTFKVHIPTDYDNINQVPLVIALHGGGHDADTMEYISKLSNKADMEGFIVVYPNGVKFLTRTWNAGTCCGNSVTLNIDDVGFVEKMITELETVYKIDPSRIYLTGASNGGSMAYRLACELPHLFAAVAPVATTMLTKGPCLPQKKVPLIHIHSIIDANVPYYGGYGIGWAGVYFPPVDSVLNFWAQNNGCILSKDTILNIGGAVGLKYKDCNQCNDVQIYKTSDGGHSWPGGNQTSTGDPVSKQINATDLMWDFFKNRHLNCVVSSVNPNETKDSGIKIYPNPSNNELCIEAYDQIVTAIFIYDLNGRRIKISTTNPVPIHNLPNGIFLIKIKTNKSEQTFRFIKK